MHRCEVCFLYYYWETFSAMIPSEMMLMFCLFVCFCRFDL